MTENTAVSLEIGAFGWDRADWVGSFYPADLPVEWRLTYYANEFDAVLIPADLWESEAASHVEAWCEDVSGRFRFFAELGTSQVDGARRRWVMSRLDALGETLHGLVLRTPADAPHGLVRELRDRYPGKALVVDDAGEAGLPRLWRPGILEGAGPIGLARFDAPPQAMELRKVLGSFLTASPGPERALFLDAPHETIETAGTLARLLGY
ncbi:MAG: hypothetical protein U9R74_14425 [Pseudomonadota bacterium]|nr:hypothetical protein [Pseudomonadota bacterium]